MRSETRSGSVRRAQSRRSARCAASLPALVAVAGLATAGPLAAQSPTYGVGRPPTPEEVRAWDIAISPTGEELPPGSGTARQGAIVYRETGCAACHGENGVGGRAPRLVKPDRRVSDPWDYGRILPIRSPYATLVWDFINRGMPLDAGETLTPDQVYALTALLLYWNDLVTEDQVIDRETLPRVEMPNVDNWAPLPDWQPGQPRLPGYPY